MDRSEWVRVPRVPTAAMLDAGTAVRKDQGLYGAYQHMLAAAPPPPAEQASGELFDTANPALIERYGVDYMEGWNAALSQRPVVTYRLLREGETILETDEHLSDDANSWRPVGNSLGRGIAYRGGFFMPIRRLAPQQPTGEEG